MDPKCHLDSEEEKKRYSFHKNEIDDKGYIQFLNRAIIPTAEYIKQGMKGLDYGCGPNPVLAHLIEKKGIECLYYDPYFYPQCDFTTKYDFVFATECFEHFFFPAQEIKRICSILKTNGTLSIMTEFITSSTSFDNWYYKNDPTHVCFYNEKSINYICNSYNLIQLYNDNHRVTILKKL